MINLNHLRIFYESAKQLNFSKAAERLYISQPAVSAQIKQLEEALQIKLFNRIGNKIHLSNGGKLLLEYAQQIFDTEIEAERALREMKEVRKGTLHIGTTKTYARYLMPGYISHFHALYPGVTFNLSEGSSLEMMHSLFNMQNELAIVASAEYPKALKSISFGREEVVLVSSPEHPLAGKESISLKEVAKSPLIMREEGSGTRRVVMDLFKTRNLTPTILYEASNLEFIKELLERGEGASFVVRSAVEKEITRGSLEEIKITNVQLLMNANIVYINEESLSKIARAFIDMLLIWDYSDENDGWNFALNHRNQA